MNEEPKRCRNCRRCTFDQLITSMHVGTIIGEEGRSYKAIDSLIPTSYYKCMKYGMGFSTSETYQYVCDDWKGFKNPRPILKQVDEE